MDDFCDGWHGLFGYEGGEGVSLSCIQLAHLSLPLLFFNVIFLPIVYCRLLQRKEALLGY